MNWYENQSEYVVTEPVTDDIHGYAGPQGLALVDVFDEGKTTKGWGSKTFMHNYVRLNFAAMPRKSRAIRKDAPFAIIMRSVRLVALDIDRHMNDGGADGFVSAVTLDLPPTRAQTSKSGAGRHLLYSMPEDPWDPDLGYVGYGDVIGLAPGIDVRSVGCIYRYGSQRWNTRPINRLPDNIRRMLETRRTMKYRSQQAGGAAVSNADIDLDDLIVIHDALLQELNRPIPVGKRNATLFAIGAQMRDDGYPHWEAQIIRRAKEVLLSSDEYMRLVSNITKYSE